MHENVPAKVVQLTEMLQKGFQHFLKNYNTFKQYRNKTAVR